MMTVARKFAVGLLAAGTSVGVVMAAPAGNADTLIHTQQVAMSCIGMSPNIIDLPYTGGVRVQTRADRPGIISVTGGSRSFGHYSTDAIITIRNNTLHTSGTVQKHYVHTAGTGSGFTIPDVYTGAGRISITTKAINQGLVVVAAPVCRGVVNVR